MVVVCGGVWWWCVVCGGGGGGVCVWGPSVPCVLRTVRAQHRPSLNLLPYPTTRTGNDLDTAYLFNDVSTLQPGAPWTGGINHTALVLLEERAYGLYWCALRKSSHTPGAVAVVVGAPWDSEAGNLVPCG